MAPTKLLPKLLQFEEVLDINSPSSSSKAVLKFGDSLKCTIVKDQGSKQNFQFAYSGDNYSLTYNVQKQDFKGKLHQKLGGVNFKLSQTVPGNRWFLVPSPRVKASTSLLDGRDTIYAKWDFQRRSGKVGDKIYFSLDGGVDCKTYVEANSTGTLQYGLRAKLNRGLAHSAAIKCHSALGPQYVLKSHPMQEAKLKATYLPQSKRLELEGKLRPTFLVRNLLVTVSYAVPLEEKESAPNGTVSLKWLF